MAQKVSEIDFFSMLSDNCVQLKNLKPLFFEYNIDILTKNGKYRGIRYTNWKSVPYFLNLQNNEEK